MRWLAILLQLLVLVGPAAAFEVDRPLADPAQEARAKSLQKELRCLVCQNQSIDDSNAPLARDLRLLLRERIAAGDSDAAALDYMVQRYGDWVLLKPPFKAGTYALWLGPPMLVLGAALGVRLWLRRRSGAEPIDTPLSADERRRLQALLAGRDDR
ncbi:MAG: cytochrome c-type biogenesis protein CcmH [Alphaproteobacteria bacterium]|nr:cytochrome c-type biogenesis protein CcmH [Alphaproteobacteria bacterium]